MWSRPSCDVCVWQLRVCFTPPANVWTITAGRKPSTVTGRSRVRFLGLKQTKIWKKWMQHEVEIIMWQQCALLCGIWVAFFPVFLSRLEKWSWAGTTDWAGSAHLSLRWSMSVCLTLRPDWVPQCLPKLPSGELQQVNTSPASFFSVYWHWGVELFRECTAALIIAIYCKKYPHIAFVRYFFLTSHPRWTTLHDSFLHCSTEDSIFSQLLKAFGKKCVVRTKLP